MRRIGIFSGTFDPVHRGHVAFAQNALEQAELDMVVFLPERSPRGKTRVGDFAHRLAMLRLATRQTSKLDVLALKDEQFTVSVTLSELQRRFVSDQLVLLCGSDVVRSFGSRWPDLEILLTQTELAVGLRAGESQADIEAFLETLPVKTAVTFIDGSHAHLSATEVRAGNLFGTDPLVREYIKTNQLYHLA